MKTISFDKVFYKKFLVVSLPIAVQQLLKALMYFIDNIMIGSLGEDAIVGVGNANQIAFFILVLILGVCGTGWVFAARFNGEGDKRGIQKTLAVCIAGTFPIAFLFYILSQTIPGSMIAIFNPLPGVVQSGGDYIRFVGISYIFTALSLSYTNVLKGCQKTWLPMFSSIIAIAVNAFLNYVLIFGKLGFPEMGVKGAAIGTAIGAFIDAALIIIISNIMRNDLAGPPTAIFERNKEMRQFVKQFIKVGTPVLFNELLWALSFMGLVFLYNRMGVAAAMVVFSVLDKLAFVIYIGIAHSCGVMVGNQLGEGNVDQAYTYAKRFLKIAPLSTIVVGGIILIIMPFFLSFYDISDATLAITKNVVYTFVCISWLMVTNFTNIMGVLRGGGDTNFAMFIDLFGSWVFCIPVGFICGLWLHWPAHIVYLCAMGSGALFKLIWGLRRFYTKKWIKDITYATR